MIEIKLSWDPDRDQAVANCRFWAPLSLTAEQKHGTSDPLEMERLGDALPDEQVAERWIVSDDPEEVVASVKQYVDWGFTHLVFHGPGSDQARFLDTFAERVLPGLRELG
jgi:coenzyme F420-dependent glucose-6-phosphate dehydrogenase